MTYWTLTYAGTEKSFADWGLGQGKRRRGNMSLTEMTLVEDGQPIDAADLFAFQSVVTIRRDRVKSGSTYSGGTQFFQGPVTDAHRVGSATSESVEYTVSNVWWYLQSIYFMQNWLPRPGLTDHIILNRSPIDHVLILVSVRDQIAAILDYALTKVPGAFTYDVSALPSIIPPPDEKRSLTCDEAIKNQMQWVQDGVVKVDETQNPPKFYFYSRFGDTAFTSSPTVQLPRVTLKLGTGKAGEQVNVASESIKALSKLVVPQVIVNYEQEEQIAGVKYINLVTDTYPPTPDGGSQLNILTMTVNLLGTNASDQIATVESRDISYYGDADWIARFSEDHPYLTRCTDVKLGSIVITDDSGVGISPLPYELLNHGTVHSWMKAGGTAAQKQRVRITGYLSYTDEFGNILDILHGKELSVSTELTNLPSGTYQKINLTQTPDPVPGLVSAGPGGANPVWNYDAGLVTTYGLSLAYWFYTILKVLQWEGEIAVDDNQSDGEVSRTDFMGVALNVLNGMPAWATMDALVQTVSEDLESGKVSVSFGQNKLLSAGKLLDLARNNRTRGYGAYVAQMQNSGATNSDIDSPSATARRSATKGTGKVNKDIAEFMDDGGATTKIIRDAINQVLSLNSDDPTKGAASISLADLVAATTPTP